MRHRAANPSLGAAALVLALAAVAPLAGARMAAAAPQTFNTALPVAKGEFVFRQQGFRRRASDDPGPAERRLDVLGAISVLGHGVTGDLALFAAIPWLDKSLASDTPRGRVTRGSRGFGDARLFARYTLWRSDAPGRTLRLAPFLGVEVPTGDNARRDRLGRLPAPLQPGSGSWDPFGGLVLTFQTLAFEIDTQAAFKFNTEADGFEFGDEARLDLSFQYRLWPRDLGAGTPGFLYGVIEGNLVHQAENRASGVRDPDSGGSVLFLAPGLQYVTRRWIAEAIVQLPLVQELNGAALGDDFILRAGLRVNL